MRKVTIYVLIDPRDNRVRYVGATAQNLLLRLNAHLREKTSQKSPRRQWIAELRSLGLRPIIRVIEEDAGIDWRDRERFWIRHYKTIVADLVNSLAGGGGCPIGYRHTDEAKKKIIESLKRRRGIPKASRAPHSPETIEKMRLAHKDKVISDDQKSKISATLMGRKLTDEGTREKLRKRGFTAEHRAKLATAAKKQWAEGRGHTRAAVGKTHDDGGQC